jgi:hypothetical protein
MIKYSKKSYTILNVDMLKFVCWFLLVVTVIFASLCKLLFFL